VRVHDARGRGDQAAGLVYNGGTVLDFLSGQDMNFFDTGPAAMRVHLERALRLLRRRVGGRFERIMLNVEIAKGVW